ncbi:MAG TPA: PadR family transcriptional regulator [Acidimicrobiales bacterium]|nr:PadR family transcriptional regulator [Acidimicrobiales bacterium]
MAPDLTPGEWAVLGVVSEGPTHGFAVSQLLAPTGRLGRIWTLPRPVVYQVLKKLLERGLIEERRTESSAKGPARTIVGATPAGRAALRRWLQEPVDHVRDVRSLLLLKLALLDRSGRDAGPLIQAQKARLAGQIEALGQARDQAEGFDRVLLEWRIASSRATVEFLAVVAP